MTWVKLDDGFPDHKKVDEAGDLAAWLFVCSLCHAAKALTDGFIADARVPKLTNLRKPVELAARLVDVGLWEKVDGGYLIHDFHNYNPSAATVKAKREADRIRKESARINRGSAGDSEQSPPPPVRTGAGAGAGLGSSSIEKEVEAQLDVECRADPTIKHPDQWKNWRRPTLEAEMVETKRKRQRNAEGFGLSLATMDPPAEPDEAADLIQGKFDDDYERELAMKGYEQNRAAS